MCDPGVLLGSIISQSGKHPYKRFLSSFRSSLAPPWKGGGGGTQGDTALMGVIVEEGKKNSCMG